MSGPSEKEIRDSLIACAESGLVEEALRVAGFLVKGPSGRNGSSVETQNHERIGTVKRRCFNMRSAKDEGAAELAGKAFAIALQALNELAELRAGGAS